MAAWLADAAGVWQKVRSQPMLAVVIGAVVLGGGYLAWRTYSVSDLPPGFAKANGRIEAERVDVATKLAGRLQEVLVKEGDTVGPWPGAGAHGHRRARGAARRRQGDGASRRSASSIRRSRCWRSARAS